MPEARERIITKAPRWNGKNGERAKTRKKKKHFSRRHTQLPVTGYQLSVGRYQLPVFSCQLAVVSCRITVVSCRLPVFRTNPFSRKSAKGQRKNAPRKHERRKNFFAADTHSCQLPVTSCQLPDTSCRLPVFSCRITVTSCRLPDTSCQLPVDRLASDLVASGITYTHMHHIFFLFGRG